MIGTCHVCGRISTVFLHRPDGSVEEYCALCIAATDDDDADDDVVEEGWV